MQPFNPETETWSQWETHAQEEYKQQTDIAAQSHEQTIQKQSERMNVMMRNLFVAQPAPVDTARTVL